MKIRRLSDFPPLPTSELEKRANDWTEVLSRVIPYENLYECYLIAAEKHKEGPFHHGKILAAWDEKRAGLPVIQTECMFCPRFMEDPSAPESCKQDPSVPETCPFHSRQSIPLQTYGRNGMVYD